MTESFQKQGYYSSEWTLSIITQRQVTVPVSGLWTLSPKDKVVTHYSSEWNMSVIIHQPFVAEWDLNEEWKCGFLKINYSCNHSSVKLVWSWNLLQAARLEEQGIRTFFHPISVSFISWWAPPPCLNPQGWVLLHVCLTASRAHLEIRLWFPDSDFCTSWVLEHEGHSSGGWFTYLCSVK